MTLVLGYYINHYGFIEFIESRVDYQSTFLMATSK